MVSAKVSAAAGGHSMVPRPYDMVKCRGPGALFKYWAQERGPHSGRDQIDKFSGLDLRLLRVGDRIWAGARHPPTLFLGASRIQALLFRQPDELCALVWNGALACQLSWCAARG